MGKGEHGNHVKGADCSLFKHGLTYGPDGKRTRLHRLWLAIRNKCNNPNTPDYKYYGARGITVCPEWNDFKRFVEDVGEPQSPELTLDRIDVDGDYAPRNVRWASRKTQARNRNYCRLDAEKAVIIRKCYSKGNTSQKELAAEFGVSQATISQIILGKIWA